MDLRQQVLDTPHALRETLEKGRPEYEEIIRRVRWGEGPIYMVAEGGSQCATLAGALAFETLLGWPVVARPSAEFETYTASVLRQRSVVMVISNTGATPESLSAARAARARGAVILALTNSPSSELAQTADFAFLTRAGAPGESGVHADLCQHAAIAYLSLLAARILKRHHHQIELMEEEFSRLPGHIDSFQIQLSDAVVTLARELKGLRRLSVVGGGFYYPTALRFSAWLRLHASLNVEGIDGGTSEGDDLISSEDRHPALLLSSSHDRMKRRICALAERLNDAGVQTFAVTDGNDRELAHTAVLSILIPGMSETVGAILTLAYLQAVTSHVARSVARDRPRPP